MSAVSDISCTVKSWGNGLGLRLNKTVAQAAGVSVDTPVHISAEPGRIVIEVMPERASLASLLARFDPLRHGGEAMAYKSPLGKEVL